MNALPERRYRFDTAAQWNACLFRGADRDAPGARAGMTPLAPFSAQPKRIPSPDAQSPCVTPAGEVLWHDATRLWRALPHAHDVLEATTAPWPLVRATRLVATRDALWVIGVPRGTLECFDLRTLTRRRAVDIASLTLLDLAPLRRGNLLILARRDMPGDPPQHLLLRLDCAGAWSELAVLAPSMQPVQLAMLATRESARVALLDADHARLFGVDLALGDAQRRDDRATPLEALWTVPLGALRTCFAASHLASDGRARFLLAGAEGRDFGGQPFVLVLDRDATLVDALRLASPATGVAAGRAQLVVSDADGIAIHARAAIASDMAGAGSSFITPLLRAPDSDSEIKWQRADIWARLPAGTSIELRYGSPADQPMRDAALRLTADRRLSLAQKFARLESLVENWSAPVTFAGTDDTASNTDAPYAFPLLDARVPELWLHVRLRATPRAALPSIARMSVSYAGSALLQQLPAVFRREAVRPGDFLGGLVGLLEASTEELDRRIGGLGSLLHPDSAPPAWLDALADWLGLPWDDALSQTQKRALLRAASVLGAQRGTRTGLALLLQSLFPGTPPRFRITDVDVDFGFASLGGRGCCGSALPAVLAGLPRSATVLSRRTILGAARLPCGGRPPSATQRLTGHLRIDLALDADERTRAQQWLGRLVEAMVPANTHVSLRWRGAPGSTFDGFGELRSAPLAHLGDDAVIGIARLPDPGAGSFI